CRISLDYVQLGPCRVALGAVGELAGEGGAFAGVLADNVAGLAGGVAGAGGVEALLDDAAGLGGVLLQVLHQPLAGDLLDDDLDLGVVQLALGLALELGVGEAHGYDGGKALAHVVAAEVGIALFEEVGLAGVVVEGAREGA